MNDDKIKNIFENKIIRERLYNAGMYPMIGPTGPREKGIEILDSYDTYEELLEKHPKGNSGDCYLIGDILYIWNQDKKEWMATESIKGPTGPSEKIEIRNTITGEENDKAQVIDNFDGEKHILDFIIPKGKQGEKGLKGDQGVAGVQGEVGPTGPSGIQGPKGDIGPKGDKGDIGPTGPKGEQGEIGPTGPKGNMGPTSYSTIGFIRYASTTESTDASIYTCRIIPGTANIIQIKNNKDITINNTGLFEITVCGRISGVTTETGGKFSLMNTTTGKDLTDLSFELNKGNTEDMDFSEVAFAEITAPANLRIKTEITGDKNTSNILFSTINVLIKGYYV